MKKVQGLNVRALSSDLRIFSPKMPVYVSSKDSKKANKAYDTLNMYMDKCGCLYPEKKKGIRTKEVLIIYTD